MIKRLTIKNYMAHKDTALELAKGVTVLTGPNNTGKSAVVEALRSLAQNPAPHHVIRHGASQATVQAELDSGEIIEWIRSKGNTVYHVHRAESDDHDNEIKKETYAKFGRIPPDDVRSLLRLDPVETETGSVDIHIGNQRYPIFLLDQTGSQAASFFAASTEAEYLLRMQQALKTRTDRAKSKRKELLQECEELEESLGRFVHLDELEYILASAEAAHEASGRLQRSLPLLEGVMEILHSTTESRFAKDVCCHVLEELKNPPELSETRPLEHALQEIQSAESRLSMRENSKAALEVLNHPPGLHDVTGPDRLIGSLNRMTHALHRQSLEVESLGRLKTPPPLGDTAGLEKAVDEMERGELALRLARAALLNLADSREPPEIQSSAPLQSIIAQMGAVAKELTLCEKRGDMLARLQTSSDLLLLEPLEGLIRSLEETEAGFRRVENCTLYLSPLTPAPLASPVVPLEELIGRMAQLEHVMEETGKQSLEIARAVEGKRREVEEIVQKSGLCPLCGQSLDLDHFLEGAHG